MLIGKTAYCLLRHSVQRCVESRRWVCAHARNHAICPIKVALKCLIAAVLVDVAYSRFCGHCQQHFTAHAQQRLFRNFRLKISAIRRRFPLIFFAFYMQNVIRFPDRDFLTKCEISTIWRRFHWFLHFLSAESSPYFYFRFILPTASSLKLIWPSTAELLLSCCWYFAWPCDLDFWPFDLDQLSYMAGHLINTAKQLEDPMPIRSWVMSYNVFQWKCVLDYCACAVSRNVM